MIVGFTTGVDFGAELAAGGGGGGGGGGGAACAEMNARIGLSSAATLCAAVALMTTTNAKIRPCTPRAAIEAFHPFSVPFCSFPDSMRLLCRSILFLLRSNSYLAR